MRNKTILALSLLTGTLAITNYSQAANPFSPNYPKLPTADINTIAQKPEYTGIVEKVDRIAEQITVRIATTEIPSYGSGVIIAREGNTYYVATAAHVLDENGTYSIVTPDDVTYELDNKTIAKSAAYDFAIFSFDSDKDYTVATVGNYTVGANSNQVVFVSGFPKNQSPERIITGGKVREQDLTSFAAKEFYSLKDNGRGLLYSNLSYKGMSGGAILDSEGRLIGINTGAENELYFDEEGNNSEIALGFSLGVPISDILGFIQQETALKIEWLQLTNNPAAEVTEGDYFSVREQLFATEAPKDNTDIAAWMNYGNLLWRSEKYADAIDAFEKVIAINPQFDRAYYGLGLAYRYQTDYQKSVTALTKAIEINPSPYFYWRYLAASYRELDRYEEAILAYEKAIAKNSEDFVLYVELADVLKGINRDSEALASYNKASELNPNHSWIYVNRGHFYYLRGKIELAIADLSQAIQVNPYNVTAYNNRGFFYSQQGNAVLALADLNHALQLRSNDPAVYVNRGSVYFRQGNIALALADFNKAISLDPELAIAYSNRGIIYDIQGQAESSLADYNKAISLNPKLSLAYYNRGLLYHQQSNFELALADYNKAISLDPKYLEAYTNRANLYYQQGNFELALVDFNRAIEIDPNFAIAYRNLGVLHKDLKNIEAARTNLEKAQQLFIAQNNVPAATEIDNLLKQLPR